MERPQRFSSTLYGLFLVASTGSRASARSRSLVARRIHAAAHRRDDGEVGRRAHHGEIEADLVVALPVRPCAT
jgi:hypothetical protein